MPAHTVPPGAHTLRVARGATAPPEVCFAGCVNLFRFLVPPQPGSVIGELRLLGGGVVPILHTEREVGPALAAADRQLALLCGRLTLVGGQRALDVRRVLPFAFALFVALVLLAVLRA